MATGLETTDALMFSSKASQNGATQLVHLRRGKSVEIWKCTTWFIHSLGSLLILCKKIMHCILHLKQRVVRTHLNWGNLLTTPLILKLLVFDIIHWKLDLELQNVDYSRCSIQPGSWTIVCIFRVIQYQRMLGTLSQCEFSMGKTLLVYDMNLKEMENYEKDYKDIGKYHCF